MSSKIIFSDIIFSHGSPSIKVIKLLDCFLGFLLALCLPSKPLKASLDRSIQKILVIRPGGIGDAVFLLPILKNLRLQGISIEILCEPRNAQIFTSQDYAVKSVTQVIGRSYDAVIDTEQWHYLSAVVAYFVRTPYSSGFSTRPLRAKLFNRRVSYGQNYHELENFIRLFEGLIDEHKPVEIDGSFELSRQAEDWACTQVPQNSVAVFIGASIPLRRFTMEQIEEIIFVLLERNLHPVLLGGQDVSVQAEQIIQKMQDSRIFNFVGKASLVQSAALIKISQAFIGPDSGIMHLAVAIGKPVVAVFGPGNLQKWGPRGAKHGVITENVSCSPCTKFGYTRPTCGGRFQCVKEIKHLADRCIAYLHKGPEEPLNKF